MSSVASASRSSCAAMRSRYAWGVTALLVLAACAGGSDLNPGFTAAVDAMQARGDCVELQAFFDRTDDADELRYIDRALERAGCYD